MGDYKEFCNYYLTPLNQYANRIPNWTFLSVTQLANGYTDAESKQNKDGISCYFSALMCKYWGLIKYFNETKGVPFEDCYDWIVDGLLKGLKYKRWQDPNYEVSKERDGARKVFNRCIWSVMNRYFQKINKVSFKANTVTSSLDEYIESKGIIEDYGIDESMALYDDGVDEYEKMENEMVVDNIINKYIKQDQIFKAMIVDIICYQDAFRYENTSKERFSKPLIVRNINKIKSEDYYLKYFCSKYKVDFTSAKELILNKLNGRCNNTISVWLNRLIDKTLKELRNNKGLIEGYAN